MYLANIKFVLLVYLNLLPYARDMYLQIGIITELVTQSVIDSQKFIVCLIYYSIRQSCNVKSIRYFCCMKKLLTVIFA